MGAVAVGGYDDKARHHGDGTTDEGTGTEVHNRMSLRFAVLLVPHVAGARGIVGTATVFLEYGDLEVDFVSAPQGGIVVVGIGQVVVECTGRIWQHRHEQQQYGCNS